MQTLTTISKDYFALSKTTDKNGYQKVMMEAAIEGGTVTALDLYPAEARKLAIMLLQAAEQCTM